MLAGRFAEVNGIGMYYEVHGEGEPLVLLARVQRFQVRLGAIRRDLAEHYKLIVPDLRGHGRPTNPDGPVHPPAVRPRRVPLLDEPGISGSGDGHQHGGMTLIHMATQQPGRRRRHRPDRGHDLLPRGSARSCARTTVESSTPEEQWAAHRRVHSTATSKSGPLRRQFHGFKDSYDDMNFTPPFLATIQARTLIVHGDRDEFFPVSIPVEMYRSIPNSYLLDHPNGGHVPIYGDNRAAFTEEVLEFLKGDREARARMSTRPGRTSDKAEWRGAVTWADEVPTQVLSRGSRPPRSARSPSWARPGCRWAARRWSGPPTWPRWTSCGPWCPRSSRSSPCCRAARWRRVFLADHGPGSTLEYHEFGLQPALVRFRGVTAAWNSLLLVDSPASVRGGGCSASTSSWPTSTGRKRRGRAVGPPASASCGWGAEGVVRFRHTVADPVLPSMQDDGWCSP